MQLSSYLATRIIIVWLYDTFYRRQGVDDITGEPLIQREDDKPEAVRKRLETYTRSTEPLIDFYKSLNILQQFHGTESNKIWPHVFDHLATCLPPKQQW